MYIGPRVKYPLFLSEFDQTWIFLIYFQKKKSKTSSFMKIVQWETSCSMRTSRHDGVNILAAVLWMRLIKRFDGIIIRKRQEGTNKILLPCHWLANFLQPWPTQCFHFLQHKNSTTKSVKYSAALVQWYKITNLMSPLVRRLVNSMWTRLLYLLQTMHYRPVQI